MPKDTFFNLPEAKRQLIERLAIDEFAQNDYHQASISRLVDRAGIAKGSFYQYFEDKQELFDYLLNMAGQEKARFLAESLGQDNEGNVFDQLRRLLRRGLEFEFSHPGLAQIGYRAYYGDAPLPPRVMDQLQESGDQFFRNIVAQGQQEGSIDPDLEPGNLAWLFSVVFNNLGDYLFKKMAIEQEELRRNGIGAINRPEYEPIVDDVIELLERASSDPGEYNAN